MIEHLEIDPERLVLLENNPRTLSKEAFARLKKSISSPQGKELFKKRPCLVNRRLSKNGWPDEADGRLIVYGGNQRFRAAVDLGFALIPCIVSEMNEEQEREEKIKDNLVVGDWDFDLLANEFEMAELTDFGLDEAILTDELPEAGKTKADGVSVALRVPLDKWGEFGERLVNLCDEFTVGFTIKKG